MLNLVETLIDNESKINLFQAKKIIVYKTLKTGKKRNNKLKQRYRKEFFKKKERNKGRVIHACKYKGIVLVNRHIMRLQIQSTFFTTQENSRQRE